MHQAAATAAQNHANVDDNDRVISSVKGFVSALIAGEESVCRHWIRVSQALAPVLQVTSLIPSIVTTPLMISPFFLCYSVQRSRSKKQRAKG